MKSNKAVYTYLISIFMLFFSSNSMSYDAVFNVSGRVQAGTCSIKSNKNQDVRLGDHSINSSFGMSKGSKTRAVRWSLEFDCAQDVGIEAVANGFGGLGSSVLSISGNDAAKGIGVETYFWMSNYASYPLRLGLTSTLVPKGKEGIKVVNFDSYYIQTEDKVTPGSANAVLSLDVKYNWCWRKIPQ
nr:fimbrial protein [Providencia rustigianii]